MLWLTKWRLRSADAGIREAAVVALSAAPASELLATELLKALDDPDTKVRQAAAKTLCARHERIAVGPLIERLLSSNPESERQVIVELLDGIDADWSMTRAAKDAGPRMIGALRDCSTVILQVLDRVDPEWTHTDAATGAVPTLIAMLRDRRAEVRGFAEGLLPRIDSQWARLAPAHDCVPVLTRWLHGEFCDLRDAALGLLAKIPDTRAAEALIMLLPHPESKVRDAAERVLKSIHSEWASSTAARAAIPAVRAALDAASDEAEIKMLAQVLSRIDPPVEKPTMAEESPARDLPQNHASVSPALQDEKKRLPTIGELIWR